MRVQGQVLVQANLKAVSQRFRSKLNLKITFENLKRPAQAGNLSHPLHPMDRPLLETSKRVSTQTCLRCWNPQVPRPLAVVPSRLG